jgi:hypothetical protein
MTEPTSKDTGIAAERLDVFDGDDVDLGETAPQGEQQPTDEAAAVLAAKAAAPGKVGS